MADFKILFTGARECNFSYNDIRDALLEAAELAYEQNADLIVLVHGGAVGADCLADQVASNLFWDVQIFDAGDFESPRERNQFMVDQGADVCVCFANTWATGSGMTARMARRAGIPVLDFGADTRS